MTAILTRAGCFVGIILLGYLLRRIGFFAKEDFNVLSKIVIRITLTAAIVTSFAGRQLEYSMLILTLIGFSFGVLLIAVGYLLNKGRGREAQSFAMLNSAGCNIGNFVLPFAQNFLGPVGVMAVSLFDVGNSFICLGGAYGAANSVRQENQKFSLRPILRTMCRSVPLMTYMLMMVLALLHLNLPGPVLEYAGIIANANAFLAMLMIGVGFQLNSNRAQILSVLRILVPRLILSFGLALVSYLVLPLPLEYRQALVICSFSPIASAAPGFTAEMKGDYGLACAVNSLSIIVSIVLIVGSLLLII